MGIESELRREIALALGVSEVTPLELVSAYGVLANGGVRVEPFAIRKVTDSQGRILEDHLPKPREVMRPEAAYVLTNVMKGVIERGTAARARVLNRPLAGKTGTTSEATDVWFIGFTPRLVAGVWVGYDVKRSLGPAETGGRMALPLWIAFMQRILPDLPPEDFPVPEDVVAVPVNHATGRRVAGNDSGTILEYFIQGTEPTLLEAEGTPGLAPPAAQASPAPPGPSPPAVAPEGPIPPRPAQASPAPAGPTSPPAAPAAPIPVAPATSPAAPSRPRVELAPPPPSNR
jgi:penicillin-binding protein 1A